MKEKVFHIMLEVQEEKGDFEKSIRALLEGLTTNEKRSLRNVLTTIEKRIDDDNA